MISLVEIGGDTPTAGIYLHIIWLKADPSQFFLYVGQSVEMQTRLDNHRSPIHRAKHPSLHYYIWDREIMDKNYAVDERFVFLLATGKVDPLLLNILEMWCCLMLQTLTRNAIAKYLPIHLIAPGAGTHLNVGIPLHQAPFSAMIDCHDPTLYHSSDSVVKQYYASLRRRFYELKFSPNAILREYYAKVIRERVISRVQTNQRDLQDFLDGSFKLAKVSSAEKGFGHQWIHLAHLNITISRRWVHLEHDAPLQVRIKLITINELETIGSFPNVYCIKAKRHDPAARLAIFVEGTSIRGQPFAGWLRTSAEKQVWKVNTLVDILEGGTMTQSRHKPRRWVVLRYENGKRDLQRLASYTSDQ